MRSISIHSVHSILVLLSLWLAYPARETMASIGPTGGSLFGTLAIDPKEPNTIYTPIDGGGVFKSLDGGENWAEVNTGLDNWGTHFVVIDPNNSNILYVSTHGEGIYKSTDAAGNWSAINEGLTNLVVFPLAIAPDDTGTIYAGTIGGGIFKTTNGGAQWAAVNRGLTNLTVRYLAIDSQTPTTVYAGTGGGVFKSTDAGDHWYAINEGLSLGSCMILLIHPRDSNTLYAGFNTAGVFKSTDGGGRWFSRNQGLSTNLNVWALAMDHQDSNTIYVGIRGWGGVFKSTDGGDHWAPTGLTNRGVTTLIINPFDARTVFAGTEGSGVFKEPRWRQKVVERDQGIQPPSDSGNSHRPKRFKRYLYEHRRWRHL